MMIAVAVVAVALGIETLRRRARAFRELALEHRYEENSYLGHADLWVRGGDGGCMEGPPPGATPEVIAEYVRGARLWARFEADLSRKYELAASRPWLPVDRDPRHP